MLRTIEIDLTYQPIIEGPPTQKENELFERASSGDQHTVNVWRDVWLKNTRLTKERFGSFAEKSVGKLYGINRMKPVIICGSGPSLKNSIKALKDNAAAEHPVMNISCLHNFGYFEDEGFHADYYVSLDSGEIVIDDVFESRNHPAEYYWEKTKGKTLLATVMSPPKLFDLWQGNIMLFTVMMPDYNLQHELQAIERFTHYVAPGGNALGGCLYIAKSIFCSEIVHFVGADFCFDYNNTFHSYKTHYDKVGGYVLWPDVFGNMRKTWQSYLNFKFWFDHIACNVPGRYVNCSEGLLGAYKEGNIRQFQYMPLEEALKPFKIMERVFVEHRDPFTQAVLKKEEVRLKDYFANPMFDKDMALL